MQFTKRFTFYLRNRHIKKWTVALVLICVTATILIWAGIPFLTYFNCNFNVTRKYFWYGEKPTAVYDNTRVFEYRSPHAFMPDDTKVSQSFGKQDFPWLSHPIISRAFTRKQHQQLMDLVQTVSNLLESSDITFMMSFGTLLGSYFFHDIIPWDDDMDLLVDIKDMEKVKALFLNEAVRRHYGLVSFGDPEDMWDLGKMKLEHASKDLNLDILKGKIVQNINKLKLPPKEKEAILQNVEGEQKSCKQWRNHVKRYYKAKFYALNGTRAGFYEWTWPFVDLIFYERIGDDICTLDADGPMYKMCQSVHTTFPLHRRPIGKLWLPAPWDTRSYLQKRFTSFHCQFGTWDHVNEQWHPKAYATHNCLDMVEFYPHVHHKCVEDGVKEDLYLGNRLIHTVTLKEPCQKNFELFSLE